MESVGFSPEADKLKVSIQLLLPLFRGFKHLSLQVHIPTMSPGDACSVITFLSPFTKWILHFSHIKCLCFWLSAKWGVNCTHSQWALYALSEPQRIPKVLPRTIPTCVPKVVTVVQHILRFFLPPVSFPQRDGDCTPYVQYGCYGHIWTGQGISDHLTNLLCAAHTVRLFVNATSFTLDCAGF